MTPVLPTRSAWKAAAALAVGACAAGACALAGCAGGGLSQPDTVLPATYGGDAAADPSLAPQALDSWWTLYRDPQLTGLVEQALRASPDARTGLQRIAESRASRAQALAVYLPQGDLQGSVQDQHTTESFGGLGVTAGLGGTGAGGATGGTGSTGTTGAQGAFLTPAGDLQTYAAGFAVTYDLDLFGRRRAAKQAADADLWAARFDYEATRSMLASNVASGLFQARGAAVQLADARETARIARSLAHAAVLSAEHGLTSTSDSARLESEAAADEAEVSRLEAVGRAARRSLLDLIGRGADRVESLPVDAVAVEPPEPPTLTPGDLLRRRPDVREAEARLRSAAGTLDLNKLGLFPDFSLAPGLQLAKTTGTYDSFSTIWSIGLNATAPVLDRPRLLAIVRGQRARGEQAVIAYEKAVQDAYRDAENGLNTLAADRRRVASLKLATSKARFAFDAKRRGYDLGLTDLTTLLDSEQTWRQVQSQFTAAEVTELMDSATLFQALGGGWTPPPQREHRA